MANANQKIESSSELFVLPISSNSKHNKNVLNADDNQFNPIRQFSVHISTPWNNVCLIICQNNGTRRHAVVFKIIAVCLKM